MSKYRISQRLGEYVKIKTGKLDANASSPDGAYPFFTCSQEPLRINSFSYECECVLVAGNGDLNIKYHNGRFDAYQRTYIIESKDKTKLDVRYLFHFMSVYVNQLRLRSIGGVIKYIKLGDLTDAYLSIPPLEDQRRIAEILDKAEALRAKRRAALAQLDTLAQSIFLEMFGDPEMNSEGIDTVTLESLCKRITDGTHQPPIWSERGYPFLFVSNIISGEITFDTQKFISDETYTSLTKRCPIEVGDVLYSSVGSYGIPAIVRTSRKFSFQRHIAQLKPNMEVLDSSFLCVMLRTPYLKKQADRAARGMAQKTINLEDIKNFIVINPPISSQREFARKIEKIEKLELNFRNSLIKMDELFSSLQYRAFSGEL